ncbi:KdsC family phosphatase [Cyclobacterium plantarum]|uniref:HAD hydrolase family protein n=1 Tax=Cyclobacterium plantarum TaxID=2716263 RepID=A0ABX0H9Y5_9BACT|nr:HAD hydrolase family protein [Cyclobacterium plantarum]NHE57183.1 HAD hydrolase family protein [Cyclobacterium plantarum]
MDHFKHIPGTLLQKAMLIKLLVSDLDGVLTDGGIILDDNGMEYKKFQVKDGQIIAYLKLSGIQTGILSGRNVKVSQVRCEQMKVDFHFHGVRDKWATLKEIIEKKGISTSEVAYIGDDLIDLELLGKVGLSAAPADAMAYIRDKVDYVTLTKGGKGAFRELADIILYAQGGLKISI